MRLCSILLELYAPDLASLHVNLLRVNVSLPLFSITVREDVPFYTAGNGSGLEVNVSPWA